MLRASANNHLSCRCFLFLTSPACTSLQCLLYTDWYQPILCSPFSASYNGKETPSLFTFQTVLFYTLGSKTRWKERELIVRDAIEITKLVPYFNRVLAWKSLRRHSVPKIGAVVGCLDLPHPFAMPLLRHIAVGELQNPIFAFCVLLRLTEICFSHSLLELSLWSIKADSIIAIALTLHKVVAASRAQ